MIVTMMIKIVMIMVFNNRDDSNYSKNTLIIKVRMMMMMIIIMVMSISVDEGN